MMISFSPPDITEEEILEVADTLRSGWITTGPKTRELERQVAALCGTERAICLNSQTACAEMALRLLGIGPGDEVITSAYTYTATASVICHVGATPILIDTQPDSFEMDYAAMEAAITEKTKAIIPVDLGGVPCDYARIFAAAENKKHLFKPSDNAIQKALGRVIVLADTAHAFGASQNGIPAGTIGDFSAFSFHAVKNITTAEGGALTWRKLRGIESDDIYRQLQLLSSHGQSKGAMEKSAPGAWEYDILGTWYKCNMTDVAAAMGLAQLRRYPAMLRRRREIIEKYDAALRPLGIQTLPHFTQTQTSSGHLYMTRVPGITARQRNEIIEKMAALGIPCNVHYKPLPMHTAYKNLGFDIENFPNAYAYFANEITLPLFSAMTDEQVDKIIAGYTQIVRAYIK